MELTLRIQFAIIFLIFSLMFAVFVGGSAYLLKIQPFAKPTQIQVVR